MATDILPPADNVIPMEQVRAWAAKLQEAGLRPPTRPESKILTMAHDDQLQTRGPLTDDEITALRIMLREFQAIKEGCPTARRLLDPN